LLEQNSLLDELFSEDHAVLHVNVVVGGAVDQEQLPEGRRRRVEVLGTVENVAILETVKFSFEHRIKIVQRTYPLHRTVFPTVRFMSTRVFILVHDKKKLLF
jgi:hypothetical protein